MLERTDRSPCFFCGVVSGPWNEPAMAADPRQAGAELSGLERRRAEVVNGQMSVHELRAHLLEMCAMCQEIMMDSDEGPSREEVLARLDYRIAHLRRAR